MAETILGEEKLWSLFYVFMLLALVSCRPQDFEYDEGRRDNHEKDEVGRVQIKVYRGPTKHDGYAPWGFWVKQPSDEE